MEGLRRDLATTPVDERRDELLVRLADGEGRTVLLYNPDNWTQTEMQNLERESPPLEGPWMRLGPAEDDDALEAYAIVLPDSLTLQVGMDADIREDAMQSMRAVFLVILMPVLLFALLGGAFMAYRALAPIRRLVEILHSVIDTGNVSTRVPEEEVRGEFGDLVRLFNRMLDRIETLVIGMHRTLDNVAHDLRTPMTRLRGRAELALQVERDPEIYREALAESVEASQAAMTMLETIMDVAEAESGTMPLHMEPVLISELIYEVIDLYQLLADDKEQALVMDVPPALEIFADRSRMRQVVANLIDNAVKYTPGGGDVHVSAEGDEREVCLRVRDTGMGITSDEIHRIWDRLYRGDRSRSQRGLGLGLSFVKAIVQAHGGRIQVQSTEGVGSVFTVRLPRR
jgi:signal transduction histidine kinase